MSESGILPDKEALHIFENYLSIVKDSPLALAALLFAIAAVALYMISIARDGIKPLPFISFALFLMFGGLLSYLTLQRKPSEVSTIYYAGQIGKAFNVGKLVRTKDNEWEDTSILTNDRAGNAYTFKYRLDGKNNSTFRFLATDRAGTMIVDTDQRQIFWHDKGKQELLYHIVVML